MRKLLLLLAVFTGFTATSYAVSREKVQSSSDFTGDNMSFSTINVSSATVGTTLANYSTSRGALTIINISSNTVYLSTSSVIGNTIQLPTGQSVEFRNNAAVFGQVAAGVAQMAVDVILEW